MTIPVGTLPEPDIEHATLDEALYAIREEVGPLTRDAENPHFTSRFTSLPALVEKVDPIAKRHGVVIRHQLNGDMLAHQTWFKGECVESYNIDLPNSQGTAQGLGSAITYMRRYDITTTFGLVADLDDDGNTASAPAPVRQEQAPAAAAVTRQAPVPVAAGAVDEEF